MLFSAEEARRHLRSGNAAPPPAARVLARFRSPSGSFLSPVRDVAWTADSRSITFLAPGADGETLQVFRADLAGGAPRQLTTSSVSVDSYGYDEETGRITYAVRVPDRKIAPDALHFVAGSMTATQIALSHIDDLWMPLYQNYVEGPGLPRHALGKPHASWFTNRIWLSPDGHWAIGRASVTDRATTARWSKSFAPLREDQLITSRVINRFDPDIMTSGVSNVSRLQLYDLASGEARPLFDAPDGGQFVGGPDSVAVAWSPDSKSVVIGNSFLPLNGPKSVVERRARSSFIAEYELATGRVTEIEPLSEKRLFDAITWRPDGRLEIEARDDLSRAFRKTGGRWVSAPVASDKAAAAETDIVFEVVQSANTPPDIWAIEKATGARKQVSELNPQFSDLSFGRVEDFDWRDADGRT